MTGSQPQRQRNPSPTRAAAPSPSENATRAPKKSPGLPASQSRPPIRSSREHEVVRMQQNESEISETSESEEYSMDEEEDSRAQSSSAKPSQTLPSHDKEQLRQLKEAVNAKMRERAMMGVAPTRTASSSMGSRRFSPIREEESSSTPTISPSLEAAFASDSPMTAGAQTASTESTESARTIRGSVPPTPGAPPLRTPSYPFPVVPGTPKTWSSSFHRPFTTLSPTVSQMNVHDHTPGDKTSEASTPAASAMNFLPKGQSPIRGGSSDEEYPLPSLYDITLETSAEPGIHAWWASVTKVINRDYHGIRACLAIPADQSDLENVPWAQIATYNAFGMPLSNPMTANTDGARDEPKPDASPKPSTPGAQRSGQESSSKKGGPKLSLLAPTRPSLSTRHSYAGFEKDKAELTTPLPSATEAARPSGPQRTKSHAARMFSQSDSPIARPSFFLSRHGTPGNSSTMSELEFSSVDTEARDAPIGPYTAVLPVMQALHTEEQAIVSSLSVTRVLEKGRPMVVIREYTMPPVPLVPNVIAPSPIPSSTPQPKQASTPAESSRHQLRLSSGYFGREMEYLAYEEYEQAPSSPWAQSPAPSPAIQPDSEGNPFFAQHAQHNVDEESFNPRGETPDYSNLKRIEAIGVDSACTILHVPLMHPNLSQVLPKTSEREEKKAPIAILSFLTRIAPYPEHLLQSMRLLAPILAMSFGMAQQYTDAQRQASSLINRRLHAGHRVGFAPFTADRGGLEDLVDADIDIPATASSVTGSMTSPSDYSGRSRASPGGSLVGTPGWELGSTIMGRLSATNTPGLGVNEASDSYFDARSSRSPIIRNSSSSGLSQLQGDEQRPSSSRKTDGSEDNRTTRKSSDVRRRTMSEDHKTLKHPAHRNGHVMSRTSSSRGAVPQQPAEKNVPRSHSYLHSYGADFASSFSLLPTTSTPTGRTPAPPNSAEQVDDLEDMMLPPSERLLRTIIDALPVQIFTAAPTTGALTWVNSKFVAYRGKSGKEILKDPWRAVHPREREDYEGSWQQSLSTGQSFATKVRLKRFDQVYRFFFVRATPLKDKRQNIVHWTGTCMDVHEQHVAESNAAKQIETAASEAKYRALANSSPQIVFAATRKGGITFCNSQWLTYSGQTEEQARALGFMDLVHPDDLPKCKLPVFNEDGTVAEVPTTVPLEVHRSDTGLSSSDDSSTSDSRTVTSPGATPTSQLPQAKLSKLATTGILKVSKDADGRPSYSTEVRLRNKDGEYRWHLVRVLQAEAVHKDEDDEEETWYGTCTDINDHKLLEQTLKETMDAKTRFLSNMSHEIRTPLNGIMGMVNFLLDSNLQPEQLEHVNIIRSSTEGLRDLINDILDLSKVEAGMIVLQPEWFHLRTLVEEVNDLTSSMAIGKNLELSYIIEDGVPSSVKGDRFRIRQVLLNVVGNAIKFTESGEVFVKVEPYTVERSDSSGSEDEMGEGDMFLQFSIIDTGAGFNKKEAEFLFKRFSQIDSSSTKQHGGTGLGLAISKQLVQLHGGDMDATSVPGEGAQFFFHAKFGIPTDDDQPPTAVGTPGPISAANTPGFAPPRRPSALPPHWSPQLSRQDSDSSAISAQSPLRHESTASSGSSDPSIATNRTSVMSTRSSVSSLASVQSPPMVLEMPSRPVKTERAPASDASSTPKSSGSSETVVASRPRSSSLALSPSQKPVSPPAPALLSVLVICPLPNSRRAIVRHIETVVPQTSPHHITAPVTLDECKKLLGIGPGSEPVIFTHVVLVSHQVEDIAMFTNQIFNFASYTSTSLVVMADFTQRKEVEAQIGEDEFTKIMDSRRFRWLTKPLKPSKFASVFDPLRQRELSADRSQDSAQAVVMSQKQIFDELKRRLGNRGMRVLLVEDNKTNQMVLQKFLSKVEITVDTVLDGQECTDAVFGNPAGHYSIILCDLHMPNKDGYQTCREIRKNERKTKSKHIPIIALSANVLGDVYQKCADAGFNSYVTKPVDFKELALVMLKYLDPADPNKPIEFMARKR